MDFCLAFFLSLLKGILYEPISDEDLINLLISDIVSKLDLKCKIGDPYYMDKRLVSKIMTNKINIPVALRKALSKEAASVSSIEMYFSKTLIPKLIPEKIDSFCRNLIVCYSDYEEASDSALSEIRACSEEKNYARVFAYLFRLSLSAPNKFDKATDKKEPVTEVDRRFPIKNIEFSDDNSIPCLQAVLHAYRSTDKNAESLYIEDYPQYKQHFQRQKEAFFAAEAVRHASRDSFLDEEDPFEDLLDESYDGVIETWERKYSDGLERMNMVLSQAVQLSMESNLISRETAWVTVRVKKGLCHILVNEGRIEGWVFDESL